MLDLHKDCVIRSVSPGQNNATPSAPVDLDSPSSLYVTTCFPFLDPKDANAPNSMDVVSLSPNRKPSLCSNCHSLVKCRCSRQAGPSSTPPQSKQAGSGHPKEIIVLNRELAHGPQGHLKRVDEQAPVTPLHGGCCGKTFCCVDKAVFTQGAPLQDSGTD